LLTVFDLRSFSIGDSLGIGDNFSVGWGERRLCGFCVLMRHLGVILYFDWRNFNGLLLDLKNLKLDFWG
jgi:hypothetical protein